MPQKALSPCCGPGCRQLVQGQRYCDDHADLAKPWATREGSGRGGRPWRRLRAAVLARANHLCQCSECKALGRLREATEVDHIIPLAQGGTDCMSNLCAINADCHAAKTRRDAQAGRRGSRRA